MGRLPFGWSGGTVRAASVLLLPLTGAALFYAARIPLDDGRDRLAPAGSAAQTMRPTTAEDPEIALGSTGRGSTGRPDVRPAPAPVSPEKPSWSLVEVGEAVRQTAPRITGLIADGRAEIPELRGMKSTDTVRADRARRRWTAWGRIWKNRIAAVAKTLPPSEACAVHAPMEPACETLRESLAALASAADAEKIETALERIDRAEEILDRFLNPPVDEGEEEDDGSESSP